MSESRDTLARIAALEQPRTTAQQRYQEASERMYSNREVEMAAGAFDRAEEVAQELDDWAHLIHTRLNTMSERLAALESPATADPVCANCDGSCQKCEDAMLERIYGGDDEPPAAPDRVQCPVCGEMANVESLVTGVWKGEPRCNCPIEPAAPEPLDPVRAIMKLVLQYGADTANAAVCYRHHKDKEADDHNEKAYMRTQEIEMAIRAYGKPVTR